MCVQRFRLSGDGRLQLDDGFIDLSAGQQGSSAIEGELGPLLSAGLATQLGGYLALGGGILFIATLSENRSEGDVRAGLFRQQCDRMAQRFFSLGGVAGLLVDGPKNGPGV